MSAVYLEAIQMKRESKSFVDSLHAVLTAAGLFQGPKYMLSGLTGMAFKFSVHERLLPMSVSAYGQWGDEHWPAVDNLGLYTIMDAGRSRHPSFSYYQREAVAWIKESLDQGIGVIYWIPEFGVIHGYDDEDGVFFVQNGWSKEDQIVLYDNLGLNETGFWYCQVVGNEIVEVPLETMALESLRLAVRDWATPFKTLPNKDIASGKLAYEYLIEGLQQSSFDDNGAVYILDSYLYSRSEIRSYLHDIRYLWPEVNQAFRQYDEVIQAVAEISNGIVEQNRIRRVDRGVIGSICKCLRRAEALEDEAVSSFRMLLSRYPSLKESILPRWGASSPR